MFCVNITIERIRVLGSFHKSNSSDISVNVIDIGELF